MPAKIRESCARPPAPVLIDWFALGDAIQAALEEYFFSPGSEFVIGRYEVDHIIGEILRRVVPLPTGGENNASNQTEPISEPADPTVT